jgi:hypothetical protein
MEAIDAFGKLFKKFSIKANFFASNLNTDVQVETG